MSCFSRHVFELGDAGHNDNGKPMMFPQSSYRLRTPAAAEYTALSPRTLEALRVRGGGPRFIRIGRAVVYDTRDLDKWLSARVQTSTSDVCEVA